MKAGPRAPVSAAMTLETPDLSTRYFGYFQGYSIKVTICVTGTCAASPEQARFCAGFAFPDSVSAERRLGYVSTTGRPSCQREDHHPRTTAAGGKSSEGTKLPPRQCVGEAQLPHR